MATTENEVVQQFVALRDQTRAQLAKMPPDDRVIAMIAIDLAEGFLVNVASIADSLAQLAQNSYGNRNR